MLQKKLILDKLQQLQETVKTSSQMIKLVWKIDSRLFTVSLVAILIPAVVPFINIYIYKLIIDLVVEIVSDRVVFDPAAFYPLIGLRILTYFFQDAAFRTQNLIDRLLWTKVPIELNQIIFKKMSELDMYYFENDKFRDLLEKVRESYDFRSQNLVSNLLYSLQSIAQVLIAFVALINLNWFFVLLIVAVAIPEFIIQTFQSKIAWGIWNTESPLKKRYWFLANLLQSHREIKEIKIFQLAGKFLGELRQIQQQFYNNNKKIALKDYYAGIGVNFLSTVVFIGIEIYVIYLALTRRVTVGDISFYTGIVSNFQNGLGGLLRNLNNVYDHSLYVKSIFELLALEPKIKFNKDGVKLSSKTAPTIEFKNVDFTYPETSLKILNNFSLVINPGEKVAFVGENGAGKSTLIKLLARFYDVDQGEILIDGVNIKDLDIKNWYQHLGVLFQDFNKYEDSAAQNIYFGNVEKELDLKQIIQASTSAGAHPMVEKLDKKYEQMLGRMFEGGIELSGGQWQKMALARAFFRNAPVLVLDEPTASIDAKAESEIFSRVEKLSKDKTVIIISHRFSTVRNADKIYVINEGKIVESGDHQQLMKQDGQYASLFNLQAKGYL